MKCLRCPSEATFNTPEKLCDRCWASWWVKGLNPKTIAAKEQLLKEVLENIDEHKNAIR